MSATETSISIPAELLPEDGRFGSGPSKVRQEALTSFLDIAPRYLGTSHRQNEVKREVSRLQNGLSELFSLPQEWEILLGNGGSTLFWDAASFNLIDFKSQHLTFGEFSSKFATVVQKAPHLEEPEIISSVPGTCPAADPSNVDVLNRLGEVYLEMGEPEKAKAVLQVYLLPSFFFFFPCGSSSYDVYCVYYVYDVYDVYAGISIGAIIAAFLKSHAGEPDYGLDDLQKAMKGFNGEQLTHPMYNNVIVSLMYTICRNKTSFSPNDKLINKVKQILESNKLKAE